MLVLDELYYIETDTNNVILRKKVERKRKGGELYMDVFDVGYYNTLGSALNKFIDINLKEEVNIDSSIERMVGKIKELKLYVLSKEEEWKKSYEQD